MVFAPATEVRRTTLVNQVRTLGAQPGGVLLVHTSFRAVRPVEDGPAGLIAALRDALGPAGTLVMPAWTGDADEPFDPTLTPASADLGIVADTFWRLPGVLRSPHPEAFAAIGPCAAEIVLRDPLPLPPHIPASPVGRVYDADGQVLLLGIGQDANTSLHLAEVMAGVPYGVPNACTVFENGQPVRLEYRENDHCCQRFALADDWLRARGLQSEGPVGHAQARLMRCRDVVAVAVAHLSIDPLIFLHDPSACCEECDEARATVPTDVAQP